MDARTIAAGGAAAILTMVGTLVWNNAEAGTVVYRKQEADGTVRYSDRSFPGAERLEIEPAPATPYVPRSELERNRARRNARSPGDDASYASMKISHPESGAVVWNATEPVGVSVQVLPQLRDRHQVVLYLDGMEVQRQEGTSFQVSNVLPGAHQLMAAVVNEGGFELLRSQPASFTLLRRSLLRPRQTLPQQPSP